MWSLVLEMRGSGHGPWCCEVLGPRWSQASPLLALGSACSLSGAEAVTEALLIFLFMTFISKAAARAQQFPPCPPSLSA